MNEDRSVLIATELQPTISNDTMYRLRWYCWANGRSCPRGRDLQSEHSVRKMAIFNIYTRKYLANGTV